LNGRIPKILSITDLRQDTAAVLRAVQSGQEPTVIMQRSRAVAVLLSVDTFERMTYEREVLGILAKGETDIRRASGVSVEQALAEADALLERGTP
jgi:prevent-host-death family protein